MSAYIIGKARKKMSLANLLSIPRFIRFDRVLLFYQGGSMTSEKSVKKSKNICNQSRMP